MLHPVRIGSAYNNLLAEDIMNRYTQGNNMSIFCGDNLSELSNAHCKTIVKKVILSHDSVILDVLMYHVQSTRLVETMTIKLKIASASFDIYCVSLSIAEYFGCQLVCFLSSIILWNIG